MRVKFKLEQLRVLLEVADPEWRSMILFGLYTVKSGSRVKLVFSGSANNFR